MGTLTHKAGVKFLKGFDRSMLGRQSGMDRRVHNELLAIFKDEYRRYGRVRTSRHRVNSWYTDLRNRSGPRWLRRSVSLMTRQTLYDLARHYDQYVETEYLKACGAEPYPEWGEPRFRKHSDRISIPLHITHDNTVGNARFLDGRTIRISKMGDIRMSRPFPTTNYRPKTGRLFQTEDGKWRITMSCGVPDPEPYVGTPVVMGVDRNGGERGHTRPTARAAAQGDKTHAERRKDRQKGAAHSVAPAEAGRQEPQTRFKTVGQGAEARRQEQAQVRRHPPHHESQKVARHSRQLHASGV